MFFSVALAVLQFANERGVYRNLPEIEIQFPVICCVHLKQYGYDGWIGGDENLMSTAFGKICQSDWMGVRVLRRRLHWQLYLFAVFKVVFHCLFNVTHALSINYRVQLIWLLFFNSTIILLCNGCQLKFRNFVRKLQKKRRQTYLKKIWFVEINDILSMVKKS